MSKTITFIDENGVEKELTVEIAYKLCVLKWKFLSGQDFADVGIASEALISKYPVLEQFKADCAYCELFNNDITTKSDEICVGCPISFGVKAPNTSAVCHELFHPYGDWCSEAIRAKDVLDLILKNKPNTNENNKRTSS